MWKIIEVCQHSLSVFPVKQVVSHSVEQKLKFIKVYYWAKSVP